MTSSRDGPQYRIKIVDNLILLDKKTFKLLKFIDDCGSITKASEKAGVPYRSALKYIENLENDINSVIVSTKKRR